MTEIKARAKPEDARKNLRRKSRGKNPRADRLKLALRENLKRRKSQARERGDVTMPPSDDDEVSAHPWSGKKPGE